MKRVVYTCITGGWDVLWPLKTVARKVAVYDEAPAARGDALSTWERVPLGVAMPETRMASRFPKMMPHMFFEADYSVWTDGHFRWKKDPVGLIDMLGPNDIAFFAHPARSCLYEEADAVLSKPTVDAELVRRQVARYRLDGYPAANGLTANGIVVRRHTSDMRELGFRWWAEMTRWWTMRDQLSLQYVMWQMGIPYTVLPGDVFDNEFASVGKHYCGKARKAKG